MIPFDRMLLEAQKRTERSLVCERLGGNGGVGVSQTSGTLIDSGTIAGGATGGTDFAGTAGVAGDAVQFGTGVTPLVVDPGAAFVGDVVANSSFADVLEFGAGTVAGSLTGVGTQFLNRNEFSFASGGTAPIRWIGHRRLNRARHPKPENVLPVLIEADAIMDGVPRRDLYVSPDHALFLGGCLIPAKALINGTTIRQVERRSVTSYHVELPEHAVLYADGVPAESYLETGNRGAFANGGEAVILHPDFAQTLREQTGCAPFAEAGPVVEVVRDRILARAAIATTNDPDLTIRTCKDGSAVIGSRSAIPGHLTPGPRDCRRLGVKIATLSIGGEDIRLDHPRLVEGRHDVEPDERWTDGRVVIPASLLQGREPAITIAGT